MMNGGGLSSRYASNGGVYVKHGGYGGHVDPSKAYGVSSMERQSNRLDASSKGHQQ